MKMFVVYSNSDEAIVCLGLTETDTICTYFTEGGRDLEDYDRKTVEEEAVFITSSLRVD